MQDHLDKSTSLSVELTETGVTAKAKSRFVAAVDRLGGNLVELVNAPMERRISRQRAISDGEAELVRAVAKFGIDKLKHDPEFAERAAEKFFTRVFEKQANKDHVLLEALEDLRHAHPDEANLSASEGTPLSDEFLDKLETYAECASTEQLRQKWGRVLSSEVRKPGTFTTKVLRIVDEIEAETAERFESLCAHRVRNGLPKCLVGQIPFHTLSRLVMAGLVLDPGLSGHIIKYVQQTTNGGQEMWVLMDEDDAVSIAKDCPLQAGSEGPLIGHDGGPAVPVYLLTDAGNSISTIFKKQSPTAFSRYVAELRKSFPDSSVIEYKRLPDGNYRSVTSGV